MCSELKCKIIGISYILNASNIIYTVMDIRNVDNLFTQDMLSPIGESSEYNIGRTGDGHNIAIPLFAFSKDAKIIEKYVHYYYYLGAILHLC